MSPSKPVMETTFFFLNFILMHAHVVSSIILSFQKFCPVNTKVEPDIDKDKCGIYLLINKMSFEDMNFQK